MDHHRSRSCSHRPRRVVSPNWQHGQRDRAHTVCLLVDDSLTDNQVLRLRRASSPGEHSLGEIHVYSSGSDGQDSVFEFSSTTTTTTTSHQSSRSQSADSSLFTPFLLLPNGGRTSPPSSAARLCYRPLQHEVPSLPRYSELSSRSHGQDREDRVESRVTPPPPYPAAVFQIQDASQTDGTEVHIHHASNSYLPKTPLMVFLLAASFQALTGALTAAVALASLGFAPDTSFIGPTFYSSGFAVFVAGIHGMIGFFFLKKKRRIMKICMTCAALFSLGCLILSAISAMESQKTADYITETYQCIERLPKGCICFPPGRPDLVLTTPGKNIDGVCSVSDAILVSLIHANIIGNLCSCVPSGVTVIVFLHVAFKHSICKRHESGDVSTLGVRNAHRGSRVPSRTSEDSNSEPPSYERACEERRCVSPNRPGFPSQGHVIELAAIPEAPPSYSTDYP